MGFGARRPFFLCYFLWFSWFRISQQSHENWSVKINMYKKKRKERWSVRRLNGCSVWNIPKPLLAGQARLNLGKRHTWLLFCSYNANVRRRTTRPERMWRLGDRGGFLFAFKKWSPASLRTSTPDRDNCPLRIVVLTESPFPPTRLSRLHYELA